MDYKEYMKLYDGLVYPRDIDKFRKEGYDSKLLETLYTQKVSRLVKKRYHSVKNDTKYMLKDWKKGTSFLNISEKKKFPPILIMMMVFQEEGYSKKQFWNIIKDPDSLENPDVANEVREAIAQDLVYSPEANEKQKERGKWGEGLLQNWLDKQGIEYMTEDDIRDIEGSTKTPDCLLKEPRMYEGHKIFWIESKASFGDNVEFRFNSRKQLVPYTEIFGPGVVVYWTGHLDGLDCPKDVYLDDIDILKKKLSEIEG